MKELLRIGEQCSVRGVWVPDELYDLIKGWLEAHALGKDLMQNPEKLANFCREIERSMS